MSDEAPAEGRVTFSFMEEQLPSSRSSLGDGVESIFSGAVLAIYDSETGLIDSEVHFGEEALSEGLSLSLPDGEYDFYLLANLVNINSEGEAEPIGFPESSSEMSDFVYRLDGGSAGEGLRRESFADMKDYGLPMCWQEKGVDVGTNPQREIILTRLVSKLTLEIDHEGLSGTDLEGFVNGSVEIRQVNSRLMPFNPEGSKALAADDIIAVGDSDSEMENGLVKTFVYYVPENRQGEILPDNDDPRKKDMDAVREATGDDEAGKKLTYLEFRGELDASATGVGGEAVYRFFLGQNATSNFDVIGGREVNVQLSFDPESVFKDDWKMDMDGVGDQRQFFLSGDYVGRLPEGKTIVVRKSRPAVFDLEFLLAEGGPNRIGSIKHVDPGYSPTSLSDIAWTADFCSSSHTAETEPKRAELNELGIEVDYADGKFTLKVSNQELFRTGERIPLELTLFPGNVSLTAEVLTMDDIEYSVADGKSITEDFYMCQDRSLEFSGFFGSTLYYCAEQDDVYRPSENKIVHNRQWKTSNSLEAAFVSCEDDGQGGVLYPYMDYSAYSGQSLPANSSLEVWSFFPNRIRDVAWAYWETAQGKIHVCSEDYFNDGLLSLDLVIDHPDYVGYNSGLSSVDVLLDGSEVWLSVPYVDEEGNDMPSDLFDSQLYDEYLRPSLELPVGEDTPWMECMSFDEDRLCLYLAKTSLDGAGIENVEFDYKNMDNCMGLAVISTNNTSKLFNRTTSIPCIVRRPSMNAVEKSFDYFNFPVMGSSVIDVALGKAFFYKGSFDGAEFDLDGPCVTYPCQEERNSGVVVEPVYELALVDGSIKFTYREADQLRKINNESIPGGLLLPYGVQTVRMKTTNKWDKREMFVNMGTATFNYTSSLVQVGIFMNSSSASIFLLTPKNAKYLHYYYNAVTDGARQFMIETLGTHGWFKHVSSSGNSYSSDGSYYPVERWLEVPRRDYNVAYYDDSQSVWSANLAKSSFNSDKYWLGNVYFYTTDPQYLFSTLLPAYTGNEYLTLTVDLLPKKEVYVFTSHPLLLAD